MRSPEKQEIIDRHVECARLAHEAAVRRGEAFGPFNEKLPRLRGLGLAYLKELDPGYKRSTKHVRKKQSSGDGFSTCWDPRFDDVDDVNETNEDYIARHMAWLEELLGKDTEKGREEKKGKSQKRKRRKKKKKKRAQGKKRGR